MKINELLVESKQEQLDELDIKKAAGSVARGAGKVIGGVAKGVGALAGIPGGVKKAFQQGKQASTDVIGGTGQGADSATPTAGQGTAIPAQQAAALAAAPTQQAAIPTQQAAAPAAAPTAQQINKAGPKGTAPAKTQTGAAAQALAKTAQATQGAGSEKAGQTLYAQVKASVDQLDKKGKQRILQLLQKSMAAPAAAPTQQAAAPAAIPREPSTSVVKTAAGEANPFGFNEKTGKPFKDQAERDAYYAGAKKADPRIARAQAAAPAAEVPAKKTKTASRVPKKAAPSQAELDADRDKIMGVTSDSVIRTGNSLAEALASKVEDHKRKMFESNLANGTTSIFKK